MGKKGLVGVAAIRVQTEFYGCGSKQSTHGVSPVLGLAGIVALTLFHNFGNIVLGGGRIRRGFRVRRGCQNLGLLAAGRDKR